MLDTSSRISLRATVIVSANRSSELDEADDVADQRGLDRTMMHLGGNRFSKAPLATDDDRNEISREAAAPKKCRAP